MARARDDLELTSTAIEADLVEVLEVDDVPLGYIHLRREGGRAELSGLFVDPPALGRGYGRRLFERAIAIAREWGSSTLELDSDPHAEGFYVALGMERVGDGPSPIDPRRRLPRMRSILS